MDYNQPKTKQIDRQDLIATKIYGCSVKNGMQRNGSSKASDETMQASQVEDKPQGLAIF